MNGNHSFPPERNRYFRGKMLTAADFITEQRYFNGKRRLINRTVLGIGVICGLGVCRNDDTSLSVETGIALDYAGREICVPAPVIRRLRMLEGYESLLKSDRAYLCLKYAQENTEPVNNIGAPDDDGEQFGKIEESYRLYLSTDEPDFSAIYGNAGTRSVRVFYRGHGLRIVGIVPRVAVSNSEMILRFLIVKGVDDPPVSFSYSLDSDYFTSETGEPLLIFEEDPEQKKDVFSVDFIVKTSSATEIYAPLSKSENEFHVRFGDFSDKTAAEPPEIYLCKNAENRTVMLNTRISTLEKHLGGEEMPIYLAKIDCLNIGTGFIIRSITSLPFEQRLRTESASRPAPPAAVSAPIAPLKPENFLKGGVHTKVETLDYWKKPTVGAAYDSRKKRLELAFGFPSTEAYDYAVSSGTVDIPIYGAIRVNARFFSEEIPHNLGLGEVCVSVSAEFESEGRRGLLFGNGDIFAVKGKNRVRVPRVECAALLFPDKGSFQAGIRLLDYVEGSSVRVRWFAYKPSRDSALFRSDGHITVKIVPSVKCVKPLERIHFKAEIEGTDDPSVTWSVRSSEGGSIDDNGLYQAPSTAGIYEITALSGADGKTAASAFILVEDSI